MRSAISPRLAIRTFSNVTRTLRRALPHLTPTLSAPEGGEGDFDLLAYCLQNACKIFHHIPIPEPDHAITSANEFPRTDFVRFRRKRVLSSVQLDQQLRRRTGEVDNVPADGVLTAKPDVDEGLAYRHPQPLLGLRHVP